MEQLQETKTEIKLRPAARAGPSPPASLRRRLPELALGVLGVIVFIIGFITYSGSIMSALLSLAGVSIIAFALMFYFFSPSRELKAEVCDAALQSSAQVYNYMLSALNIKSNGMYIPASRIGSTKLFLPLSDENYDHALAPKLENGELAFVKTTDLKGVYMAPPGEGLLKYVKSIGASFTLESLEKDIRDALENSTELAARATVKRDGDHVSVVMNDIADKRLCRTVREADPRLCLWSGCPTCSFAGCMVAECTNMNARIESVSVEGDTIRVTYSLS